MLDFNSHDISDALSQCIDAALERAHQQETPRTYLGASTLGDACARRLQYQCLSRPVDAGRSVEGRTVRVFFRGHAMEAWVAQWLRQAGFALRTHDEHGEQFGFALAHGRVQGHADGILDGGPALLTYPCLWETKAVGHRTFAELQRHRLARARPVYATQVALYQAYLRLHEQPALFTAVCADDMRLYAERVPFDAGLAQSASDRAVSILRACEAGELLPRVATTPAHVECRRCAWQERCWRA